MSTFCIRFRMDHTAMKQHIYRISGNNFIQRKFRSFLIQCNNSISHG